ncbi:hypothetical protein JXB28_02105 [Candidatus Woesearchaeota archaeon]|nr:hypothetical protein [Candidatus Woesearchaeota archaeon]
MHIIHSFKDKRLDEHAHSDCAFLITNKRGNYLSLGQNNFTHMQGLFFLEQGRWQLYKAIEDIKLSAQQAGEMVSIRNNFFSAQRTYKSGAEESFNLFNNSMIYSINGYDGEITLELDFRGIFERPEWGRVYSIANEGDIIIIRYDQHSDASLSHIEKTRFMAIKGANQWRKLDEWVKKDYAYDMRRGSASEYYAYQAIGISTPSDQSLKLVFSFAETKEKAVEHANTVYENKEYLLNSMRNYCAHTFTSKDLATNCAIKALDDLLITIHREERKVGIIAGLPWFYQLWARDELISIKALVLQEKYHLVKSVLFKYLNSMSNDGLIASRFPGNPADVKSIDSTGWLFLRLKDFIDALNAKKILNEHLSLSEIITIKRALEVAINGLLHHHLQNGLIVNNEQETWMDTKPARRDGACIEIQALFLSMLSLHTQIATMTRAKPLFKSFEKDFKALVRKEFFVDGELKDSVHTSLPEKAIRPNIFLASYICPGLLLRKEWKRAFDKALKELWLDWGGLTTLNHNNHRFRSEYTGTNDASYHNGDSWYYVNNYAAIALNRLDPSYYAKYIQRICNASKEEMLFSGFIGCCAEVSSAKAMRSEGCLSQAWSAASLIELLHELNFHG